MQTKTAHARAQTNTTIQTYYNNKKQTSFLEDKFLIEGNPFARESWFGEVLSPTQGNGSTTGLAPSQVNSFLSNSKRPSAAVMMKYMAIMAKPSLINAVYVVRVICPSPKI